MRIVSLAVTAALVTLACGKSVKERAGDVAFCSGTAEAAFIAACLRTRDWDSVSADSAATLRAVELDSMFRWQADSAWRIDSVIHAADLARCADRPGDLSQCLRLAGWPPDRATRVADSLWNTRAADHQNQVRNCVQGSAGGNIADCLMLYYKWDSGRALAANDSVQRARARS